MRQEMVVARYESRSGMSTCLPRGEFCLRKARGWISARDYRRRPMIYYTLWRCVSSSEQSLLLSPPADTIGAFAKPSLTASADVIGDRVTWHLTAYNCDKKND